VVTGKDRSNDLSVLKKHQPGRRGLDLLHREQLAVVHPPPRTSGGDAVSDCFSHVRRRKFSPPSSMSRIPGPIYQRGRRLAQTFEFRVKTCAGEDIPFLTLFPITNMPFLCPNTNVPNVFRRTRPIRFGCKWKGWGALSCNIKIFERRLGREGWKKKASPFR